MSVLNFVIAKLGTQRNIKEKFHNGETYYKMHGSKLHLLGKKELKPKTEFITWHNENVYKYPMSSVQGQMSFLLIKSI